MAGRPKKEGTEVVFIRIPKTLAEGLREEATKHGRELSGHIRFILEGHSNGTGSNQDVRRVDDVPVEGRSTSTTAPVERADQRFTSIQRDVALRTGHPFGCDCFQCLQTQRFLKPQPAKKREQPAAKKRRVRN